MDRFRPQIREPKELEVLVSWEEDPPFDMPGSAFPSWVIRINGEFTYSSKKENKSEVVERAVKKSKILANDKGMKVTLKILNKDGSVSETRNYEPSWER